MEATIVYWGYIGIVEKNIEEEDQLTLSESACEPVVAQDEPPDKDEGGQSEKQPV